MSSSPPAITPECIGSQTVGPYYAIGLDYMVTDTLAGNSVPGRHLTISGTLFDGDGIPVPDAVIELWQASAEGRYPTEAGDVGGFKGFARLSTHDNGRFSVRTIAPGAVPFLDGRKQAPHIVVLVFMRGLMRHLVTRIYLGNSDEHEVDPVLQLVPASRRSSLIAQQVAEDRQHLQWDIHLQGEQETVFFAC